MPLDLLIVLVIFASVSMFCLGWMLVNLFKTMRNDGLSMSLRVRFQQTKQILLKPFLGICVTGLFCSIYMATRNHWVAL